jgi:hypothetical protein
MCSFGAGLCVGIVQAPDAPGAMFEEDLEADPALNR